MSHVTYATGFDIEFGVPDDLFSIAIAGDDDVAADQLHHFVDQRCGADASPVTKAGTLAQLLAARAALQLDSVVWTGVMSAPVDGKWVLAHFGLSVRPLRRGETTASLAADVERRYQDDAVVEEFPTRHCEAIGIRRIGTLIAADEAVTTAVAQVVCVFGAQRGLATVTGIALSLEDLDVTTLIVGAIADTVVLRPRAAGVAG
ncbi:MAG: hypothetical protein JWM93_1148 [Frankiales bacterium]|nr:hypothetical protein [Frankiales bacterium]